MLNSKQFTSEKIISVKSNLFMKAYYRCLLADKRLMEIIISKINPSWDSDDLYDKEITITHREYQKAYKGTLTNSRNQIVEGTKRIFNMDIIVRTSEISQKGTYSELSFKLLQSFHFDDSHSTVTVRITREAIPHFVDIKGKFTSVLLSKGAEMRSIHTWKLLEYIQGEMAGREFCDFGLTVENWIEMLGLKKGLIYGNLKRSLEISVKYLDKLGYDIELDPSKKIGKKVLFLNMYVTKKGSK